MARQKLLMEVPLYLQEIINNQKPKSQIPYSPPVPSPSSTVIDEPDFEEQKPEVEEQKLEGKLKVAPTKVRDIGT